MGMVHVLVFCFFAVKTSVALQWSHNTAGVSIGACARDNVTLFWNFTTDPGEHVMNVEWRFKLRGHTQEILIATDVEGNFLPVPAAYPRKLEFVSNAGIQILNASASETGTYSVRVNLNLHGSVVTETQSVGLIVSESTPECATDADRIGALQELVRNLTTQNSQLRHEKDSLTQIVQNLTSEVQTLRQEGKQQSGEIQSLLARIQQLEATYGVTTTTTTTTPAFPPTPTTTHSPDPPFLDCQEVMQYHNESGVYTLLLDGNVTRQAYCDQETDGGGWTVIQRRQDGSWNFHRGMQEYIDGFGRLNSEFWWGLDNMHRLTYAGQYSLRVDLVDTDNNTAYAEYTQFNVSDEADQHRLQAVWLNGTAGDAFGFPTMDQIGWPFSTPDWDRDGLPNGNCGADNRGNSGWWFGKNCGMANLNGRYNFEGRWGVVWYTWKGDYTLFRKVEMKIRSYADRV